MYYYSNKNECDFLVKEGIKIRGAIQVCYILSEDTKEREVNGLLEVMHKFMLKESIILTYEQESELKIKGKKIRVLPVWKWLLM